ncbi:hypothetical protein [Argonema antarcticum]|uniref:hypothetical protein n=1 Tax=Argonema antarcticum TaxID=2942763 RepID=UPI002012D4ED|nr:hypothetical protein [Argonema antarcticum]MCL1469262.1 hypothetical protein [Argonema antarcticum A004/B2]
MGNKAVAELTVEELKAIIAQVVDERLQQERHLSIPVKKRSLQEVMESVDRHRWTPPAGSPTGSEMIIAEREKWRQPM